MNKRFSILSIFVLVTLIIGGCSPAAISPTAAPAATFVQPTQALAQPPATNAPQPTANVPAPTAPPAANTDRPLIYPLGADPDTLFPDYSGTALGASMAALIYNALTTIDLQGKVAPDLATSWEVSLDKLTWTFHLVKNAKWQDGQPFTANDVKFTYETIADPTYTGNMYNTITSIAGAVDKHDGKAKEVSGIKVIDENTVSFTTTEPDALVLDTFAGSNLVIYPEHILKSVPIADMKGSDYSRSPIGTGPYKITSWLSAESMTFERNEFYFGPKPIISKIIFKIIPEPSAIVTALLNKEVDIVDELAAENLKVVEGKPGIVVKSIPGAEYENFNLNVNDPFFKEVRVRQAMAYAIDRQSMLAALVDGKGTIENTFFHPTRPEYDANIVGFDYNVEKAKQLLKEAGWADINGDGILEAKGVSGVADGTPFKIELATTTTPFYVQENEIIQQNLKAVGIGSTINQQEFGSFFSNTFIAGGKWQASGLGWVNLIGTPQMELGWNVMCPVETNTYGYCNPELDALIKKNSTLFDDKARYENFFAIQQMVHDAAFIIPMIRPDSMLAYRDDLVPTDFKTGIDIYRTLGQWHWK